MFLIALHSQASIGDLVACKVAPSADLAGRDLPKRIKLFAWGENQTCTKGRFVVNEETVNALAANQAALGFDQIALDFNHNSLPGHPNYQPDPRQVAAYGKPVVIAGEGLFLDDLSFTPSGVKFAREYVDLSPTVSRDANDVVTFIHSAALCPQGEVKGLQFLSADFLKPLFSLSKTKPKKTMPTDKLKELLCAILGLDPKTASEEEITDAAQDHAEKLASKGDALKGATGGDDKKPVGEDKKPEGGDGKPGDVEKLEELSALAAEIRAIRSELEAGKRSGLMALAASQGKEIPKSLESLSVVQLEEVIKTLPVTIPLSRRTPDGSAVVGLSSSGISAEQAEVNARLGITDAQFKKHGV